LGNEIYKVRTRAKPIDGEANEAVVGLVAAYFGIKKYQVKVVRGEVSRRKVMEINKENPSARIQAFGL
jgi:uncharacterized protein